MFQIGKYPFLDRVILVIEVDPVFESLGHYRLGDLKEDDFVRGLDSGHEELCLLHVSGEPVDKETGGRGHLCHGQRQKVNYFILRLFSYNIVRIFCHVCCSHQEQAGRWLESRKASPTSLYQTSPRPWDNSHTHKMTTLLCPDLRRSPVDR